MKSIDCSELDTRPARTLARHSLLTSKLSDYKNPNYISTTLILDYAGQDDYEYIIGYLIEGGDIPEGHSFYNTEFIQHPFFDPPDPELDKAIWEIVKFYSGEENK